jgi:hypothetical protein
MTDVSVIAAERRYTPVPVELRATGTERRIGGYAAVFNRESQNLGGFIEVVNPGFFNDSKSRGWPDVLARYNHDDMALLGTTGGGTLTLRIDDTGLDYDVIVPEARSDVLELVSRGDIRKSSFAFRVGVGGDDWTMNDQKYPLRTLLQGQLVDVAPVNSPAYTDTTAGKRALFVLDEARAAIESLARKFEADVTEVRALAEADDLRRFFVRTDGPQAPKKLTIVDARAMVARRLAD